MLRFFSLLTAALIVVGTAQAREPTADEAASAISNLQQDVISCMVFHRISEAAFSKQPAPPGWQEAVKRSRQHVDLFLPLAVRLMEHLKQDPDALRARIELQMTAMSEGEMKGNFSNYSILLAKYANLCGALAVDIAPRLQFWLDRAMRQPR